MFIDAIQTSYDGDATAASRNLISVNDDGSSFRRITSVLSKRCGAAFRSARSADRPSHCARRNASRRYFRFYCRNRPSIERADDSSRINSTVYEGKRVGNARASIRADEPRPKTHREYLIRDEPIPWWILIALACSITLSFPRHDVELHGSISLRLHQIRFPSTSTSGKLVIAFNTR